MSAEEDIAIIGMSCRLPGAQNIDQFWRNLLDEVESITFFSDEELLASGIDPAVLANPDYVKAAPKLDNIDEFDAGFFGYSPKEASLIDPQHRLFLEVAWEAFEKGGYSPDNVHDIVGVYSGAGSHITSYFAAHPDHPMMRGETAGIEHISNDKDFLSTRVSYKLNLTGPSITVQTACSTSLVAVHLACQGILNGECDMAIAGASALRVPHVSGYLAEKGGVRSQDGHCRSFDADGTGTIFGSGVVAVLLKPLDAAIRDNDEVIAVIKSTCINNDGANKVSYTAPSVTGQARAMAEALALADVHPDSIDYVECHATGTVVGDPLEIQALSKAFRLQTEREGYCAVGSVKSNIGHPEQAAGLAGLAKAALALKYRTIPATLHLKTPNPNIPFEGSPFFVADKLLAWPESDSPRRAAVNSLGIGGTNAFVVLEQAPPIARRNDDEEAAQLFCLSARNKHDLAARALQFSSLLDTEKQPALADLCYTTNKSRSSHKQRAAGVVRDKDDLAKFLAGIADDASQAARSVGNQAPIVFLFSGQGAQFTGMGRELYRQREAFRIAFDECSALFSTRLGLDLKQVMFGENQVDVNIDSTRFAQPALFTFEYAMTRLWESIGIRPDAVIGHSLGEITAACIAGAINLEDAVELVSHRSFCMQKAPTGGAMAAVSANKKTVQAAIEELDSGVEIASLNSVVNTVISGDEHEVGRVVAHLEQAGIRTQTLNVSHAFHSCMMEPVLDEFEDGIGQLSYRQPAKAFVSNVTGRFADHSLVMDKRYWRDHVRNTVNFSSGMSTLLAAGYGLFIEVGPGQSMLAMARQNAGKENAAWVASTVAGSGEEKSFLAAVGEVYIQGHDPDWQALAPGAVTSGNMLPTYPFNRQSHWLEPPLDTGVPTRGTYRPDAVLGRPVQAGGNALEFEFTYGLVSQTDLTDHRILGQPILPTTSVIELARRAGAYRFGAGIQRVYDLIWHEAIVMPETRDTRFKLTISSQTADSANFELMCADSTGTWQRKVSGTVSSSGNPSQAEPEISDREAFIKAADAAFERDALYAGLKRLGLEYGPGFQLVKNMYLKGDVSLMELDNPDQARGISSMLLDATLHAYPFLLGDEAQLWLPFRMGAIHFMGNGTATKWATMRVTGRSGDEVLLEIHLLDEEGQTLVQLDSLAIRQLPAAALAEASSQVFKSWLYASRWQQSANGKAPVRVASFCLTGSNDAELSLAGRGLEEQGQQVLPYPAAAESQADHIVYFSDLDGLDDKSPVSVLNARLENDLQPALALIKEIASASGRQTRLWFVTRGAQQVGSEVVNPVAAALWGLAQTVTLEYPQLAISCVDLDPGQAIEESLGQLAFPELVSLTGEDQFALRDDGCFVRRFERLDEQPVAGERKAIKANASYLITGGLGSLGLQFSQWLVQTHGIRSLILTSRSKPGEAAQKAIDDLRKMGCQVSVVQADVAVESDVEQLFSALDGLPDLRGLIHCAGVLADGVIATLEWEDFVRSFAAKVSGAWLLHQHSKNLELDFFILQSSILSLIGSAGQANYTAANAFLDSFANYRQNLGLAASVQNWGPWSDSGMATAAGERGARIWQSRGLSYIDTREGVRVFAHLVENGIKQAAVGDFDWPKYMAGLAGERNYYEQFGLPVDASEKLLGDDLHEQLAGTPASEQLELILSAIQQEVSLELGFDTLIEPGQPLNELGLDSLLAVSLSNRLENRLHFTVPVVEMIQGPSLSQLASYIHGSGGDGPAAAETKETGIQLAANGQSEVHGNGWLVFPKPNPNASFRLFCFNYAGGGAMIYRPWAEHIGDHIELVAIEPPGRGSRTKEASISDLGQYRKELLGAMKPFMDKPCALFGHCLGGLNLYESALSLSQLNKHAIEHIFVSGSRPPHEVASISDFEEELVKTLLEYENYNPFKKFYEQPDDIFIEIIRKFDIGATDDFIAHQELRNILLPAIRADFEMAGTYSPRGCRPLDVPITCFQGVDDTYVSNGQAVGWSQYTRNEFRLLYRESAHYIVVEDRQFIIDTINDTLLNHRTRL